MPDRDLPDDLTAYRPAPDVRPIEAIIGRNIAKRGVLVGPVVVVVAWLLAGPVGAASAAVGVVIVMGNFLLGGYLLSVAARISLSLYHAAALFGFLIRLGLITLTMLVVANTTGVDRASMGISAVVSYLVLLSLEAVAVVNGAERELEWSN